MKMIESFVEIIEEKTGLFFDPSRKKYLQDAIEKRMATLGINNEEDYYTLLTSPSFEQKEILELSKFITIPETSFFRHQEQFEAFEEGVLPEIIKDRKKQGKPEIKIWSAGCSTGEEPYSLAFILTANKERLQGLKVQIYASDINENALKIARQGVYPQREVTKLPKKYQRFFTFKDDVCIVKREIKEIIKFMRINLVKEPFPLYLFNDLDVIFCRNVFIYFRERTIKRILRNFHICLRENGYLFLAPTEALTIDKQLFSTEKVGKSFVYRKTLYQQSLETARKKESPILPKAIIKPPTHLEKMPLPKSSPKSPKELLKMAKQFADIGAYQETVQICHKLLDNYPTLPEAHLFLGIVYYETGKVEEAISSFKKAIYLNPDFALAHFYLGNIYWHLGEVNKALRSYKNVLKAVSKGPHYGILPEIMDVISAGELEKIAKEYIKA